MSNSLIPILYSFRRCPYAMRTRFVLRSVSQSVEIREIKLQNKPKEFLKVTNLGTVPVMILSKSEVLLESLDIINWCLKNSKNIEERKIVHNQNDITWEYIKIVDNEFKYNLDRYKYPTRYSNKDPNLYRKNNLSFLEDLNNRLKNSKFLFSDEICFSDYCIFPFIRQFRNVDIDWFEKLNFKFLNNWFSIIVNGVAFENIMRKYKLWEPNDKPVITNFKYN